MAMSQQKQVAEAERWIADPLYWARKFSGPDFDPWSGQEELWQAYGRILNAKIKRYKGAPMTDQEKVDARKHGISVMAGQGLGKERTVALIGEHYLFVLQKVRPKVVCTAPAGPTLHSTLWPEFGKVTADSPLLRDVFEKQSNRIFLRDDEHRGEFMRIEPRTIQQNAAPEEQAETLAGIHATGVLYIVTEASGVAEPVFKPLEGGLTDPLSLIILIFNPTRRTGFAIESHGKNRADWICVHWSGRTLKQEKLANPSRFKWFNADAQDVLIRKYGNDHPFVRIRVDGLPAMESTDTLIPLEDVLAATERQIVTLPTDPLVIPVDVAGEGEDKTIVMPFQGPRVLAIHAYEKKNTTEISDLVAGHLREYLMAADDQAQYAIGVDTIGIGRGVYDQLVNVQQLRHCYAIDVSEKPLDERRFHRLRDQVWWEAREAFVEHRTPVIPVDDELIAELTLPKWKEVNGKIKVESKPELKKRGEASPNKGDAFCIGNYLLNHCVSRMPARARRRRQHATAVGAGYNWKTR